MSGINYTYPMMNNGRKSNYTEDPKIANKMVYKSLIFSQREASKKDPTNQMNKWYYGLRKWVFLKNIEELPNICAWFRNIAFWMQSAQKWNHNSPMVVQNTKQVQVSINENEAYHLEKEVVEQ